MKKVFEGRETDKAGNHYFLAIREGDNLKFHYAENFGEE